MPDLPCPTSKWIRFVETRKVCGDGPSSRFLALIHISEWYVDIPAWRSPYFDTIPWYELETLGGWSGDSGPLICLMAIRSSSCHVSR